MARLLGFLGLLLISTTSFGVTRVLTTTVLSTLSDATYYGGCMASLADRPDSVGLDCNGAWAAFSCTGDFAGKDAANRNFEMAQIAYLTGRRVRVYMDDTKRHNGYCFGRRIDLLPQ